MFSEVPQFDTLDANQENAPKQTTQSKESTTPSFDEMMQDIDDTLEGLDKQETQYLREQMGSPAYKLAEQYVQQLTRETRIDTKNGPEQVLERFGLQKGQLMLLALNGISIIPNVRNGTLELTHDRGEFVQDNMKRPTSTIHVLKGQQVQTSVLETQFGRQLHVGIRDSEDTTIPLNLDFQTKITGNTGDILGQFSKEFSQDTEMPDSPQKTLVESTLPQEVRRGNLTLHLPEGNQQFDGMGEMELTYHGVDGDISIPIQVQAAKNTAQLVPRPMAFVMTLPTEGEVAQRIQDLTPYMPDVQGKLGPLTNAQFWSVLGVLQQNPTAES